MCFTGSGSCFSRLGCEYVSHYFVLYEITKCLFLFAFSNPITLTEDNLHIQTDFLCSSFASASTPFHLIDRKILGSVSQNSIPTIAPPSRMHWKPTSRTYAKPNNPSTFSHSRIVAKKDVGVESSSTVHGYLTSGREIRKSRSMASLQSIQAMHTAKCLNRGPRG